MLDEALRLAKAGFAIHWLHSRSKAPIGNDWASKPVATKIGLTQSYVAGNNVGVRLGKWSKVGGLYLHVIDLDIRKPNLAAEAHSKLTELLPEWRTYPTVVSGSGGESRHLYVLTATPYPSKKLAKSDTFELVFDDKVKRDVKKRDWEIEFFGTGKQVAIPPSIHPDTGKPYRWLRAFDFDMLDMGLGPIVDDAYVGSLINYVPPAAEDADPERLKPLGMSVEEVEAALAKVPNDDIDYDDWLNIMASVQHESAGRPMDERKRFYEAFRAWSARSAKHDDKTTKFKFFSFKNTDPSRIRSMRSVMSMVRENELMDAIDQLDESDDIGTATMPAAGDGELGDDDLLGDAPVSKRQAKLNKAEVEQDLEIVPPRIKRLNKKHAIAMVKGKTVILHFERNGTVSYGSPNDLHAFYENDRVATEKATEPVTKAWQRHKARRQYPNGIVFEPNKEAPGAYNHWQGWSVEPDSTKDCHLFLKHLLHVICQDDEANYRYLLGWMAHMIQRPEEKPGVAVIFRGQEGHRQGHSRRVHRRFVSAPSRHRRQPGTVDGEIQPASGKMPSLAG